MDLETGWIVENGTVGDGFGVGGEISTDLGLGFVAVGMGKYSTMVH